MSAERSPDVDFFKQAVIDCPYPAYDWLREHAPVWKDPATGAYVVTRYEDVRRILLDAEHFTNETGSTASRREALTRPDDPAAAPRQAAVAQRAERLRRLYEERGCVPAPNLDALDDPRHLQLRRLFDEIFRASTIKRYDDFIAATARRLVDAFIEHGSCEWVAEFAVPLPLLVIGHLVGVPEEDLPQIKRWTEAYVSRMSLTQTDAEAFASAEQEIEMQHYFQRHIDHLRRSPDDTFLSQLVNREIPEWGRPLTDSELHAEILTDLFVGGAETTTNALSEGAVLLVRQPETWRRAKRDAAAVLPTFVEEVLRLESPVQTLMRQARVDVELHGVLIPAGSVVSLRYGAANRDGTEFDHASELDLARQRPSRHLAFGVGTHHCLGAPLARRELILGFEELLRRVDDLSFIPGANDFEHHQNYYLRSLKELHVAFRPAVAHA